MNIHAGPCQDWTTAHIRSPSLTCPDHSLGFPAWRVGLLPPPPELGPLLQRANLTGQFIHFGGDYYLSELFIHAFLNYQEDDINLPIDHTLNVF